MYRTTYSPMLPTYVGRYPVMADARASSYLEKTFSEKSYVFRHSSGRYRTYLNRYLVKTLLSTADLKIGLTP